MPGPKWTIGFVLRMNSSQFDSKIRRVAAKVREVDYLQKKTLLSYHQHQRSLLAIERAGMTRNAIAAAGLFTTLSTLRRVYKGLTSAAVDYQYEARSLSLLLKAQGRTGDSLYRQFERLNPSIREFAPTEVISRMKQLAQAGYSQTEILKNMGAILDATRASMGELSLKTAVELGINLDRAFGTPTKGMRELLDTAAAAANQFPMTMGQITRSMGYATEAAVEFQQPLDEVLITLGLLMPVVKTAEKAGTAYRNMMQSLAKAGTIEFLEKFGIQAKDNNGVMREGLDIYLDIYKVLEKLDKEDTSKSRLKREAVIRKIAGTRGAAGLAMIERLQTTVTGAAGTPFAGMKFADREAAVMAVRMGIAGVGNETKNLADSLRETSRVLRENLTVAVERAGIAIGTYWLPLQDRWNRALTGMLDWISAAITPDKPSGPSIGGGMVADFFSAAGVSGALGALGMGAVYTISTLHTAGNILKSLDKQFNVASEAADKARGMSVAGGPGVPDSLLDPDSTPRQTPTRRRTRGPSYPSRRAAKRAYRQPRRRGRGPIDYSALSQSAEDASETLKGVGHWGKNFLGVSNGWLDWTAKFMGGLGLVTGAWTVAVDAINAARHALFDLGDMAKREMQARYAKFGDAENMMWKFIEEGPAKEDTTRAYRMGFSPQVANMQAFLEAGGSYFGAWEAGLKDQEALIREKFKFMPEEIPEQLKLLKEYKEANKRAVLERSLQYEAMVYAKGGTIDGVTKAQMEAKQAQGLRSPEKVDPEGYAKGRRAGQYTLGYNEKMIEDYLTAKAQLQYFEGLGGEDPGGLARAQSDLASAEAVLSWLNPFANSIKDLFTVKDLYRPGEMPPTYKSTNYGSADVVNRWNEPGVQAQVRAAGEAALREANRQSAERTAEAAGLQVTAATGFSTAVSQFSELLKSFGPNMSIEPAAGRH